MTKAQQKALDKAEKYNFNENQKIFLKNPKLKAWQHTFVAAWFHTLNKIYQDDTEAIDGAMNVLSRIIKIYEYDETMTKCYAYTYLRNPGCIDYLLSLPKKIQLLMKYVLWYTDKDTRREDIKFISEQLLAAIPEEDVESVGWNIYKDANENSYTMQDILGRQANIYAVGILEEHLDKERVKQFAGAVTSENFPLFLAMRNTVIQNFLKSDATVEEAFAYSWDYIRYIMDKHQEKKQSLYGLSDKYPKDEQEFIYHIPENEKVLALEAFNTEMLVNMHSFGYRYNWRDYGLIIIFEKYDKIKILSDAKSYPVNPHKEMTILITFDGKFFRKRHKRESFIPLSVKDLTKFYDVRDIHFDTFLDGVCEYYLKKGKPFIKDVLAYVKTGNFLPPTALHDLMEYTSFQHAYGKKYMIGKNWNTNDINWLYMLHLLKPYISEIDMRRLKERPYNEELKKIENYLMNSRLNRPKAHYSPQKKVLQILLESKFQAISVEYAYVISDYINMCFDTGEKVKLGFLSFRKLKAEHDRISEKYCAKRTKPVKVSKKSQFAMLSKELLPEFEWITTKKRLVHEAQSMHHCVWQYANKITKDRCAIYHFVFSGDGKPYTVEIVNGSKGYYVRQVYGIWDSYSNDAMKYVCGKISEVNSKMKEKIKAACKSAA